MGRKGPQYDVEFPAPVGPDNHNYDDAVRFSPFLWTSLDLSLAVAFTIVFSILAFLSHGARWQSLRSTSGLRRPVLFGVVLSQLALFLAKVLRDAGQLHKMDWLDDPGAACFDLVLTVSAEGARAAVMCILLRTAMCFIRARLVPDKRQRYEVTKVFFTGACIIYGVFLAFFSLSVVSYLFFVAIGWSTSPDVASADLVYGVEVLTMALDATFLLLNGIAMLLAGMAWRFNRDKKALRLYFLASTIFMVLFGLRLTIITLRMIFHARPWLWDPRQGFKKPLIVAEEDAEFVEIMAYMYDVVIWGVLMSAGLFTLTVLARLGNAWMGNDTGLAGGFADGDYRDDEPQSQPSAPPPLIDVSGGESQPRQEQGEHR